METVVTVAKAKWRHQTRRRIRKSVNNNITTYFTKTFTFQHTVVPVIDSNNHQTFFSKPKYVYNLISTHLDDFKRQLFLNPITATDYDITNGELSFNIDDNDYFDIVYGGVVPGTLNKQHSAQLIPKVPGSSITKKIEVTMTVTVSAVLILASHLRFSSGIIS
jgi:hypothetical protein